MKEKQQGEMTKLKKQSRNGAAQKEFASVELYRRKLLPKRGQRSAGTEHKNSPETERPGRNLRLLNYTDENSFPSEGSEVQGRNS